LFLLELGSPGLEGFGLEGVLLGVFSLTGVVVAGHPEDIDAVIPLLQNGPLPHKLNLRSK